MVADPCVREATLTQALCLVGVVLIFVFFLDVLEQVVIELLQLGFIVSCLRRVKKGTRDTT